MRQIAHLIIGDKIWQPVWVPDRQKWTIALTGKDGELIREAKEFGEFSYKVQAITRLMNFICRES